MGKTKCSGSQNRKKKSKEAEMNKKLSQSMSKFIKTNVNQNTSTDTMNSQKSQSVIVVLDNADTDCQPDDENSQFQSVFLAESQNNASSLASSQSSETISTEREEESQPISDYELVSSFGQITDNFTQNPEIEMLQKEKAGTEIFSQVSQDIVDSDSELNGDVEMSEESQDEREVKTVENSDSSGSDIWKKDFEDPGTWPNIITEKIQSLIIYTGPVQVKNIEFPKNHTGRRFNSSMYKSADGKGNRDWLIYSKSKNSVYCFPCKLFNSKKNQFSGESGVSDFSNVTRLLKDHEATRDHKESVLSWVNFISQSKSGKTFGNFTMKKIQQEVEQWTSVFDRLLSVTKFLGKQNLAFRGSNVTLYSENNGNFLGLVQLLSEFDPVMKEHVKRANGKEIPDHYLSGHIQNDLIDIISSGIQEKILSSCKAAKYFSIICDCTRDVSRVEQMSLSIRYVKTSLDGVSIEENFLGFIEAPLSTGLGLKNTIVEVLKNLGLDLDNCRGQGYDNGSNMAGKNIGVQKRILEENPRAFYVPCSAHKLNLVLLDVAECNVISMSFFGTIQAVYTVFAGSTQRWSVLKSHISSFTLKPLSETRWESRVNSVKAFRYQMGEIYYALIEISSSSKYDRDSRFNAGNLANQIKTFPFIMSTVIWYEILFRVNLVSKKLQTSTLELDSAIAEMDKLVEFFISFQSSGFQESRNSAAQIASDFDVEPVFEESIKSRSRQPKRRFGQDKEPVVKITPEEKFKQQFFDVLLVQCQKSLSKRFKQIKAHNSIFGFLYNIEQVKNLSSSDLRLKCDKLDKVLKHQNKSDLSGAELQDELKRLSPMIPPKSTALQVLEYILKNNYQRSFPNVIIALKILCTLPVSVSTGERSFSRLKLIKTYLRSTMSQERLSGLAMISIEKELADSLDYKTLIKKFSEQKVRKIILNSK